MNGHSWIAWDRFFIHKPFGKALLDRFGQAGVVVFLAFVCECKSGSPPGTFTYAGTDMAGLRELGLAGQELVDPRGRPWSLDDLWRFTGRYKVTRKTRYADVMHVKLTHWAQWQKENRRAANTQRMAAKRAHSVRAARAQAAHPTSTSTTTSPLPQSKGKNSRTNGTNPRARGTNPRTSGRGSQEPPDYPELKPTTNGAAMDPVHLRDSAAALRARLDKQARPS